MVTLGLIQPPTYEERLLAVGSNRSGKSVFMRELLDCYPRWVAIDLKGDFHPQGKYQLVKRPDDSWGWKADRILYRPEPAYTSGYWLNEVFRRLYLRGKRIGRRKPFVVYVDESLMLSRMRRTEWMAAVAIAGASLGIGFWYSSQRTKWIPVELRSEAWRWYVFYLSDEEDEKEVLRKAKGHPQLASLEQLRAGWGIRDGSRPETPPVSFWELRRHDRGGGRIDVAHHLAIDVTPVKKAQ